MGVYINMEMPENCALCPMWDAGNCLTASEAIICEYNKRPQDCPLVPVREHGRLIDADALNEAMARMVPWAIDDPTANAFLDGLSAAYEAIQAAPTVIEAEEVLGGLK